MKNLLSIVLAVNLFFLPCCKEQVSPKPQTQPINPITQTHVDSDGDGIVSSEDDIDGDGNQSETDPFILFAIRAKLDGYQSMLAELKLKSDLNSLERWSSDEMELSDGENLVYAIALQNEQGFRGYLIYGINVSASLFFTYGIYDNAEGRAILFDHTSLAIISVGMNDFKAIQLASDDNEYWNCMGKCIKNSLDGFAGSVIASLCAACVIEPSKLSCAACLAAIGATAAACAWECW